jgi:hypothetical protein
MMKLVAAALLAATLALSPRLDAGACATPPPAVAVVTVTDAMIADGGGVIVQNERPEPPAWAFHGGKPLGNADLELLAPALYRFAMPKPAGWATLEDADHKPMLRVQHATKPIDPLAAPQPKAVVRTDTTSRRGTFVRVTATFTAVPTDAIAVILYSGDSKPVARSWARVTAGTVDVSMYASGSCIVVPVGTIESAVGDAVAFAWVDASGRVSAKSAPIKIKAG